MDEIKQKLAKGELLKISAVSLWGHYDLVTTDKNLQPSSTTPTLKEHRDHLNKGLN